MKATKKIIAVLVCAFALCFALVGCDSEPNSTRRTSRATGSWAGLTEGDTTYSESDISMLKAWGMEVKLSLNEDETMVLEYFGETAEGNWEPKDATTFKMTAMGDSIDGKLADGMISIEVEGAEMKFKKME